MSFKLIECLIAGCFVHIVAAALDFIQGVAGMPKRLSRTGISEFRFFGLSWAV